MSLEVKLSIVVLAPVCLVGMVYGLTQGEWVSAGLFAALFVVSVVNYRAEKQRLSEGPEDAHPRLHELS